MAIAVTLNNVANLQDTTTAATTINNNNSTLNTALQDGLSRSGNSPNTMGANIDMSSNHILNLPAPGGPLEPVRLMDVTSSLNVVSGPVTYGSAPSAKVGLTAVTGVALTVAHSDSLPALDQTIAPVWTGQHTFFTAGGTITGLILSGATAGSLTIQSQGCAGGVVTFPTATDQLVGRATTDTLTNKTLSSPTISGGALGVVTLVNPTVTGNLPGTYNLTGTVTINNPTITAGAINAVTINNSTISNGNINSAIIGSSGGNTNVGFFTTLQGTAITGTTSVLSNGTGGIGYSTGAGGTVTQGTSRTTGVTLNKTTGYINLFQVNGSSGKVDSFSLTNSTIAAGDIIVTNVLNSVAATRGVYHINAECSSGAALIEVKYIPGQQTSEAPTIYFSVIKSVSS